MVGGTLEWELGLHWLIKTKTSLFKLLNLSETKLRKIIMSQMPMCAVKRLEYFKITLNLASGLLFWKDWSLCMLKAVSIEWKAHTERESCGSLE